MKFELARSILSHRGRSGRRQQHRSRRNLLVEALERRDLMAARVWDGGGGDNNWSTGANWVGDQVPNSGDDLVFSGSTRLSTVNNISNKTFASLTFDSSQPFTVAGNSVVLTGGVSTTSAAAAHQLTAGLVIDNASSGLTITSGMTSSLVISGGITGTGYVSLNANSSGSILLSTTSLNVSGIVSNSGTGSGTVTISGAVGSSVTEIKQASTTSGLLVSGAIAVNNLNEHGTILRNTSGTQKLVVTGAITGTGNLTLKNDSDTDDGIYLQGSVNHAGKVTNSGTGSGKTRIGTSTPNATGAILGNVTDVIQDSIDSPLWLRAANSFAWGSTTNGLQIKRGTVYADNYTTVLGGGMVLLGEASSPDAATLLIGDSGTYTNKIKLVDGAQGTLTIGSNANNSPGVTFTGGVTGSGNLTVANNSTVASSQVTLSVTAISHTGNLILQNNTATASGVTIAADINIAANNNDTGTITNSGSGLGSVLISGAVGSSVKGITQASTTSGLTVSGAITVNSTATTLLNTLGTQKLVVTGTITGTGNLTLKNNSDTDDGIYIQYTVNNAGLVTNSGTGTGGVRFGTSGINPPGIISTSVTGVVQDSATSRLLLRSRNTFTSGLTVKRGTVNADNDASVLGTGAVTLGNSAGGSDAATLLLGDSFTYPNAIKLASNTTGVLTIGSYANNSPGVTFTGGVTGNNSLTVVNNSTVASSLVTFSSGSLNHAGNLTLKNNVATASGITISAAVNNTVTITNSGAGSGSVEISGAMASSVTEIKQASTTSGLTVSGSITVNSTATTLRNTLGTQKLVVTGAITGTGNLILKNDSDTHDGIYLQGSVNHAGKVTNSGTGTGKTRIGTSTPNAIGAILGYVTDVIQDSINSPLWLRAANSFASGSTTNGLQIKRGTVYADNYTTVLGGGMVLLGEASSPDAATLLIGDSGTYTNKIKLVDGAQGTLTVGSYANNSPGVVFTGGVTGSGNLTVANNSTVASSLVTLSGTAIGHTGNLILQNNTATASGVTIAAAVTIVANNNNTGTITNSGSGSGSVEISGAVGSSVKGITQDSTTSGLTVSGAISVNNNGKTFRNIAGGKQLIISGSVNGSGPSILSNDSTLASGVDLAGMIDSSGSITNAGSGTGSSLISGNINHASASVIQDSETSALVLEPGSHTEGGSTTVKSGTLQALYNAIGYYEQGLVEVDGGSSILQVYGLQRFDELKLKNGAAITGSGELSGDEVTLESGSVSAQLTATTLVKTTPGTVVLTGTHWIDNGTTIEEGTLTVDGQLSDAGATIDVLITGNGTLGGNGTVGGTISVSSGGTVAPGTASGILTTKNVVLSTGSTFAVQLGGTTAGSGGSSHDQLRTSSTGSVSIASGVTLNVSTINAFAPNRGDTFTVIDNLGSAAISGRFSGLLEGDVVVAGTTAYRISYVGGTGNDVVLTAVADIEIVSITAVGSTLTANVAVKYASVPSYTIKLFESADGINAAEDALTSTEITNGTYLTPGLHSIVLNSSFGDSVRDYILIAKVDTFTHEASTSNNTAPFYGVYLDATAKVLKIYQGSSANSVTVAESGGQLVVTLSPNTVPPYWGTDATGLSSMLALIATTPQYMNLDNPYDANDDGVITNADANVVSSYLQGSGSPQNKDVNGDGFVTPLDALTIIGYVNAISADVFPGFNVNNPWDVNGDGTITSADATALSAVLPSVQKLTFSAAAVDRINVRTGDGNDAITIANSVTKPTLLLAGAGNDSVFGGGGSDRIFGGAGNDTLNGRAGDDSYDFLSNSNLGSDTITEAPGGGADLINLAGTTGATPLDYATTAPQSFGNVTLTLTTPKSIEYAVPSANSDSNAVSYVVPGQVGETTKVTFAFNRNDALYKNQLFVDVGGITSSTPLFTANSSETPTGSTVTHEYAAGTVLTFRVKQDGGNKPDGPILSANPAGNGGSDQVRTATVGKTMFMYWEDIVGTGSDYDYNDITYSVVASTVVGVSAPGMAAPVFEAGGSEYFTFTRTGDISQPLEVEYRLLPASTATAGADYSRLYPLLQTVGVVSFPANQASVTVPVTVINDSLIEGPETVDIELVAPGTGAGYELNPSATTAYVVIEDDDTDRNNSKYCPGCSCNIGCAIGNFFEEVGAAIIDVGVGVSKLASAAGSFISNSLAEMRNISSSNPHPIVSIDVIVTQAMADADVVEATLAFASLSPFSVYYSTDNLVVGETVRIAMQPDASLLQTGRYHWELTVTEHTGTSTSDRTYQGDRDILNLKESYYGVRWQPKNVDYLVLGQTGGVLLVEGDGNLSWFKGSTTTGFARTQGENGHSQLTYNPTTSTYTLTSSYGSQRDFNAAGLLIAERDSNGRGTSYAYTDANSDSLVREISTITDHVGRVTTYTYTTNYDSLGNRQIKIKDFANRETLVHIAGATNLVMWVDEPDPVTSDSVPAPRTSFTYDPGTKLLTSLENADGDSYQFGYDETRTLDSITDSSGVEREVDSEITSGLVYPSSGLGTFANPAPLGKAFGIRYDNASNATKYTTNNYGQWTSATDARNKTTYFERNAEGWLLKTIQPDPDDAGPVGPLVTTYEYDAKGNRTKQTNPDGSYRSWSYDPTFSRVTSFTDELNHTTLYTIDPTNGDLLSERRVVGLVDHSSNNQTDDVVTTYTYTPAPTLPSHAPKGLLKSVTDAEQRTTEFAYNASGLLRFVTYAVGTADEDFIEYQYDSLDRVEFAYDELRRKTTYGYDRLNRLTRVTYEDPDTGDSIPAPFVELEYDDSHRLRKVTDQLSRLTEYHYNALGQLDKIYTPDHDGDGNRTVTEYRYDAYNRLEEIEDAEDAIQTLIYDNLGRVEESQLPHPTGNSSLIGPRYKQSWGATGWTLTSTDPLTTVTTYAYQLIQEVGERDDSENWEPARFVTTTITAHPVTGVAGAGPQSSEEYDAVGNLVKSTDALGRVTVYEYDELDRLKKVIQPDPDLFFDTSATPPAWVNGPLTSPITQYAYDKVGNLKTVIDPNQGITTYNYDFRNRLISIVEPNPLTGAATGGPTTHYSYYDTGELKTLTDAEGGLTNYYYDELGRLEIVDLPDPDGSNPLPRPQLQYQYDYGNQLRFSILTDSASSIYQVTEYNYDDHGNLETITEADPDGAGPLLSPVWLYSYDDLGNRLSEIDPLERKTVYTYDALSQLETVSYRDKFGVEPADTPRWTYAYDLAGNLKSATDRLAHATTYNYDKLHRLTSVSDALSHTTSYNYDAVGNVIQVKDAENRRQAYRYDSLDRLTQEFFVDTNGAELSTSPRTTYGYDAIGNLKSTKDRLNHTTSYNYDYLNRRKSEIDANQAVTSYTYDAVGNLKTLTDPEQNTTSWLYDKLNRVTHETNQLGKARTYKYDTANNLVEKVDREQRKTTYVYDNLNRNTAEKWHDGTNAVIRTLSFAYDAAGQLKNAADPSATYVFDYDTVGRLNYQSQDIAGLTPQIVLERLYDSGDRLSWVKATIGGTADFRNDYHYDDANRLQWIKQGGQSAGNAVAEKRVDFSYNDANQWDVITRYADVAGTDMVATTSYGYDPGIGRLTSITHAQGSTSLAGYGYDYDLVGRIDEISSLLDGVTTYSHDDRGQLTGANHASITDENYSYDDNGNRDMAGHDVDPNNRLMSDGTNNYEYDDEGNRTAKVTIDTGERVEYGWDHRNRLVTITSKTSGGTVTKTVEQSYDVFNQWVRSVVDSNGPAAGGVSERFFVYDDGQIVLEFDGGAASDLTHRYLWGNAIDQILADETVTSLGNAGTVTWPLTDHLGTARDLASYNAGTDTTSVANHRIYDSFGSLVSETNAAVDHLFGFTGRPFDETTGLQNNLNRWYNAETGTWLSEDPIGFAAGDANLGRYVGNLVLGAIDPNGLFTFIINGLASTFGAKAAAAAAKSDMVRAQVKSYVEYWYEPIHTPIPRGSQVTSFFYCPNYGKEAFEAGDPTHTTTRYEVYKESQETLAEAASVFGPGIGGLKSVPSRSGARTVTGIADDLGRAPSPLVQRTVPKPTLRKIPPTVAKAVEKTAAQQIATDSAQGFKNLECVEAADAIKESLRKAGKQGKWIRIELPGNGPIRSKSTGKVISEAGLHEAVDVDGMIFDNLHPNGINRRDFFDDLEPVDPKLDFNIWEYPI